MTVPIVDANSIVDVDDGIVWSANKTLQIKENNDIIVFLQTIDWYPVSIYLSDKLVIDVNHISTLLTTIDK